MASPTQINSKVLGLIARHAEENAGIDLDTPVDELDIDSLAMFEIVYELEESFAVELDEAMLNNMATVRDLADSIRRELENSGRGVQPARAGGRPPCPA
ncbi:MAG: acyl carrier protein [Gammaproteobacteria bacterium]|nr:acyl carrier protein [Gammaproteobacteria bacterium]